MMTAIGGKTIAITRPREDSEEFVRLAQNDNATPLTLPTIELVGRGEEIVDEFLRSAREYDPDYSVFMSPNAVKLLFDTAQRASKLGELRLAVSGAAVVAVGPKTREALQDYGVRVAHVPPTYSSVGVGEVLSRLNAVGKRAIIPRSGASTPFLRQLLNKIGLDVREILLYDVRASGDAAATAAQWDEFRRLFSQDGVDGIVYTSASSVRAFFEIMERGGDCTRDKLLEGLAKTQVVSIGPFTADELGKLGVPNTVSRVHTVHGAFDTIRDILGTQNS